MAEINLHFTGDFHAITTANNLLAAMLDNHLYWGNELGIDPRRVTWRRAMDMNDRALRSIVTSLGGNGAPREDHFDITVASEVMAVFCLARDLPDLQARLGRIIVAHRRDGSAVTARDLKADGAMAALLRDALMPNLVQTLEGSPALVHGGPFANIAHGCNSVMATRLALKLADVVVTEAGFGADLGGEKFLDIKCRSAGLTPSCCVVVATIRALKMHGGVARADLGQEDLGALNRGMANLARHVENMGQFGLPVVVALNRFTSDTPAEFEAVRTAMGVRGVEVVMCDHWSQGSAGAVGLAQAVLRRIAEGARPFRAALSQRDAAGREAADGRPADLPGARYRTAAGRGAPVGRVRGGRVWRSYRSAWPRRPTVSAPTRRFWVRRRAMCCRSATCACRPARGSWWQFAAMS